MDENTDTHAPASCCLETDPLGRWQISNFDTCEAADVVACDQVAETFTITRTPSVTTPCLEPLRS